MQLVHPPPFQSYGDGTFYERRSSKAVLCCSSSCAQIILQCVKGEGETNIDIVKTGWVDVDVPAL